MKNAIVFLILHKELKTKENATSNFAGTNICTQSLFSEELLLLASLCTSRNLWYTITLLHLEYTQKISTSWTKRKPSFETSKKFKSLNLRTLQKTLPWTQFNLFNLLNNKTWVNFSFGIGTKQKYEHWTSHKPFFLMSIARVCPWPNIFPVKQH